MNKTKAISKVEALLVKQLKKDPRLKNIYLLVHSEKYGLDINIAAGSTNNTPASPQQPNYMASVGKLFTSTIVCMLAEEGKLSWDDKISRYLDDDVMNGLHVYNGIDYSNDITIRQLLQHTSGLNDYFWPLLEHALNDPEYRITPQQAISWAKQHLQPEFPPGGGFKYTDTNYLLLGLIVENITEKPFHDVLRTYLYEPLNMNHSFMLHYSRPKFQSEQPVADFYIKGTRMIDHVGYAGLDYSGGGVVAPTAELLTFMKALVNHQLVKKETLDRMKNDPAKYGPGIDYGLGTMQFKSIPLLMPKKWKVWGVAGATGAYMFYHPEYETYIIGNFNDFAYERKGVMFMFRVINILSKLKND
ncbi:serine hydrolase domain-containing protein [Paenibacillus septentrionalis]|uniref:Serine hydrolase domain-containing protein n=2 Tax=Paenibacillus septentrionalis TaxID=429342 RepID=A0ABW1V7H7_9BACL